MAPYINFKELAERIDVTHAASLLNLDLNPSQHELRGPCPACKSEDSRSLCVMPQTNSFRCYSAKVSGDSIALVAHINGSGMYKAAQDLTWLAGEGPKPTAPQAPRQGANPAQPKAPAKHVPFDPQAFAEKLVYSDEVSALSINEDDAKRLSIGFMNRGLLKGRVCIPVRNVDGSIAGFIGWNGTDLKVPPRWLMPADNVIKLKRA